MLNRARTVGLRSGIIGLAGILAAVGCGGAQRESRYAASDSAPVGSRPPTSPEGRAAHATTRDSDGAGGRAGSMAASDEGGESMHDASVARTESAPSAGAPRSSPAAAAKAVTREEGRADLRIAPAPMAPPMPSGASAAAAAPTGGPATPIAIATDEHATPPRMPEPVIVARRARPTPQSGQLTAGVWDDNRNPEFFRPYLANAARQGRDTSIFNQLTPETGRDAVLATMGPHQALDIQLVLDTTGSMGDELSYLQSEFDSIAAQVHTRFPQIVPRWSLVVYRDVGDEYVTRGYPFTNNAETFRQQLQQQSARGGGDTPEAVVQGLNKGLDQQWSTDSRTARMIFWVADAPAHRGEGRALGDTILRAQKLGVHVYPVASSDTDDEAEYQMRNTAKLTGGRYLFLTDDSGVGNSHSEPHIPCYAVSRLDRAIVRMVDHEVSGRYTPTPDQDVVRQVGNPNSEGRCRTAQGLLVATY